MAKRKRRRYKPPQKQKKPLKPASEFKPSELERIPLSYQDIHDYFSAFESVSPFLLRAETLRRIEKVTGRVLICYVSKTHHLLRNDAAYIDDGDLHGFGDLIGSVEGNEIDILIRSNGGSVEATERIVRLLRNQFSNIRYFVPGNAYSAATLMCFSGDVVVMDVIATLGPIDPQINGVPARAILRSMESLEERLKKEGPRSLPAYLPLIQKYDLHIFEICKSAQELSSDLAKEYLSKYMFKVDIGDHKIKKIVDFFSDYDRHKSHGRSIDRDQCRDYGLKVEFLEDQKELVDLIRSLNNQYESFFDKSPFYKVYENAHGINWGRQSMTVEVPIQLPPGSPVSPEPKPGPPSRSD